MHRVGMPLLNTINRVQIRKGKRNSVCLMRKWRFLSAQVIIDIVLVPVANVAAIVVVGGGHDGGGASAGGQ